MQIILLEVQQWNSIACMHYTCFLLTTAATNTPIAARMPMQADVRTMKSTMILVVRGY